MTYLRATIALLALLVSGVAFAGPADDLIKQGDGEYAQRTKAGMAEKSIESYQQALAIDDSKSEAYWKIALSYYWIGAHKKGDAAGKIFREGIEFAKLAIEVNPKDPGGHFWLAVSYGKFGEIKGIMQSLHLVDPMKASLKKAMALDPNFEFGGPDRVTCRLYAKLPGFKGGDSGKAVKHCRKAVKLGPKLHMNHVFLAEALIKDGKKAEAKTVLEAVLKLPDFAKRLPEGIAQKAIAKKLLADL